MGVDVSLAVDQVVSAIAGNFPDFDVRAGEDADRAPLKLPAILVDLAELEPDPEGDRTTGEWPCLVHFRAKVVFEFRKDRVRRAVARAAGALAAFAHNNRLGVEWGGGVVIDVGPDDFEPRAGQVDLWAVEWVHRADIGPWFETEDGVTPTEVYFAWGPDTGPDHAADYERADE